MSADAPDKNTPDKPDHPDAPTSSSPTSPAPTSSAPTSSAPTSSAPTSPGAGSPVLGSTPPASPTLGSPPGGSAGGAAVAGPPVARGAGAAGAAAAAAAPAPVLGRLPAPATPPARVSSQPWAKGDTDEEAADGPTWTAGGDTIMLGGPAAGQPGGPGTALGQPVGSGTAVGQPGGPGIALGQPGGAGAAAGQSGVGAGQGTAETARLRAGVALAGQSTRAAAPPAVATPELAEPVGGTVYGGDRAAALERELHSGRPLDQLRLDWHRAPVAALDSIDVPQAVTGLLLGTDDAQRSVVIRLFRPEVTRVAMVGGLWLVRLLVFRSLGLGARVVVFTNRSTAWQGFGQAATGRPDRLVVLDSERPVAVAAGPSSPVLHVYDLGTAGPTQAAPLGPWNAQLTVLPALTAFGFAAIEAAHLTLLRRLSESEAAAATPVLGLAGATPALVQQVRDDMVTVVGGGQTRFAFLHPTGVEGSMLGSPSAEGQPAAPASITAAPSSAPSA